LGIIAAREIIAATSAATLAPQTPIYQPWLIMALTFPGEIILLSLKVLLVL
jgi:hypothetical protein